MAAGGALAPHVVLGSHARDTLSCHAVDVWVNFQPCILTRS